MKTIEECVVIAMDGSDKELYPFLPYILQDIWEIGADPDTIIKMIGSHYERCNNLNILDLGCGKGAVSIKLSQQLGCRCFGIDAIPEFIEYARKKATELKIHHLCRFETGDIRLKVKDLSGYDVIILGAIGPVFGDYFTTLTTLSQCINENGAFVIDEAYIDDDNDFSHPYMIKKSDLLSQLDNAGMKLVENEIMNPDDIKTSDDFIFEKISKRCHELIEKHPRKQNLFLDYIKKQETENDVLENKVIGTTMMIKKK